MSYAFRNQDGPHAAIRDGLRKLGWLVQDLSGAADGAADLIALTPPRVVLVPARQVVLMEVKRLKGPRGGGGGSLTPKQQKLINEGWPIRVVRSLEDALSWG